VVDPLDVYAFANASAIFVHHPLLLQSRFDSTYQMISNADRAQVAVDIESQLILHADVTQATNDKQQLVPALAALQALPESLGALTDIVADAGYYSEANAVACEGAGVTPYLAMSRKRHRSWLDAKLRKAKSAPGEDARPADRMAYRLQTSDGRALYSKRKSTVETTFGIMKSAMGFRSFLLRGIQKVEGELTLVCTAYNFKRLFRLVAAWPKEPAAA
jgi:IS5 family transposase